jgi:hypothetical protein
MQIGYNQWHKKYHQTENKPRRWKKQKWNFNVSLKAVSYTLRILSEYDAHL